MENLKVTISNFFLTESQTLSLLKNLLQSKPKFPSLNASSNPKASKGSPEVALKLVFQNPVIFFSTELNTFFQKFPLKSPIFSSFDQFSGTGLF